MSASAWKRRSWRYSMSAAQKHRLSKFLTADTLSVVVPIDHGLTLGPIPGLERISDAIPILSHPAVRGFVAHKGALERLLGGGRYADKGVMLHLNGMVSSARTADTKVRVASLETAVRL